jgi:hypothetical protein
LLRLMRLLLRHRRATWTSLRSAASSLNSSLVEELADGLRDAATDHDRWTLNCVRKHSRQLLRAVADLVEVSDLADARAQLQTTLLMASDPTPDAPAKGDDGGCLTGPSRAAFGITR